MKMNGIVLSTNSKKILLLVLALRICCVDAKNKNSFEEKQFGKNALDMTDADLDNLLHQWEQDDDPLDPDELPEHLRPQNKIDLSKIDLSNPDDFLKISKKGKSIMMFIDVNPEILESEADNILLIWQSSLRNNHIIAERYPIDKRRAIFMFADGSQAVDAKNFIIEQPECLHVTLEGQNFVGKHANRKAMENIQKLTSKAKVEKIKKSEKIEL